MDLKPFKELSDDRQLDLVDFIVNESWHSDLLAIIESELREYGFKDAEISYSGFYSQGDGASFTSSSIDLNLFFEKEKPNMTFQFSGDNCKDANEILELFDIEDKFLIKEVIKYGLYCGRVIRSNNHYFHEKTIDVDLDMEIYTTINKIDETNWEAYEFSMKETKEIEDFYAYFINYISDWVESKCKDIYSRLQKEWENYQKELYAQLMEENDLFTP